MMRRAFHAMVTVMRGRRADGPLMPAARIRYHIGGGPSPPHLGLPRDLSPLCESTVGFSRACRAWLGISLFLSLPPKCSMGYSSRSQSTGEEGGDDGSMQALARGET